MNEAKTPTDVNLRQFWEEAVPRILTIEVLKDAPDLDSLPFKAFIEWNNGTSAIPDLGSSPWETGFKQPRVFHSLRKTVTDPDEIFHAFFFPWGPVEQHSETGEPFRNMVAMMIELQTDLSAVGLAVIVPDDDGVKYETSFIIHSEEEMPGILKQGATEESESGQ